MPGLKTFVNAAATGILIFVLWDVLAHASEPIDRGLSEEQIGAALGEGCHCRRRARGELDRTG